jgi:hypothetical protein
MYFVLMFVSFNVFYYQMSVSGRDHFYMSLKYNNNNNNNDP